MRRARRPSQTSPQVDEYNDCYVPSQFTAVSDLALRHQLHNTRFPRLGLWWLVGGAGRLNVLYHETELDDSIMCGLAQPQHSKLGAWSTDPLGGRFYQPLVSSRLYSAFSVRKHVPSANMCRAFRPHPLRATVDHNVGPMLF